MMLGAEVLDDPRADPAAVRRTLRDIVRLNRLFGGTGAVMWGLRSILERSGMGDGGCGMRWSLLDVGTGAGDIPVAAARLARRYGIELVPIGLERIPAAARAIHRHLGDPPGGIDEGPERSPRRHLDHPALAAPLEEPHPTIVGQDRGPARDVAGDCVHVRQRGADVDSVDGAHGKRSSVIGCRLTVDSYRQPRTDDR